MPYSIIAGMPMVGFSPGGRALHQVVQGLLQTVFSPITGNPCQVDDCQQKFAKDVRCEAVPGCHGLFERCQFDGGLLSLPGGIIPGWLLGARRESTR